MGSGEGGHALPAMVMAARVRVGLRGCEGGRGAVVPEGRVPRGGVAVDPGLHAPSLGDERAHLVNVRNADGEVVCADTQQQETGLQVSKAG